MSNVSDDELSLILSYIPDKSDRKSFALVCKQWLRVEGQNRLSIRVLETGRLQYFLPRFPKLLEFTSPRLLSDAHLELVAKTCPELETLDLHFNPTNSNFGKFGSVSYIVDFGDYGIRAIANGCPKLSKVWLRGRKNIGNLGIMWIVDSLAQNLTFLDIGRCTLINDLSLKAIGRLSSISVLKLDGCYLITDRGLTFLAEGSCSKCLKRLSVAECDRVTDTGVSLLSKMCCLEELSLAECGQNVTDVGGVAIASIRTLKRLDLSWLINLSDVTPIAIAEQCRDLVAIDLTGCEMITGVGLHGFGNHVRLESLILAACENISQNDLAVVLQCPSLRNIMLNDGLRMWMPEAVHNNN